MNDKSGGEKTDLSVHGSSSNMRSGLEGPTYSQLLALAERSAKHSIRTHRKTYSSVISRGTERRSQRDEIIPRWTGGRQCRPTRTGRKRGVRRGLLIHRPASKGTSTGGRRAASRSVRPVLPFLPLRLRAQKGRGEGC